MLAAKILHVLLRALDSPFLPFRFLSHLVAAREKACLVDLPVGLINNKAA